DCTTHEFLFLRSAATIGAQEPALAWTRFQERFLDKPEFCWIAASYADALPRSFVPASVLEYLESWIRDPAQIRKSGFIDNEVPANVVASALAERRTRLDHSSRPFEDELNVLDRTLEVSDLEDWMGGVSVVLTRQSLFARIAGGTGVGAVEFLAASL